MTLVWLIAIPALGAVLAWLSSRWGSQWPRWVAQAVMAANLILAIAVWLGVFGPAPAGPWLAELQLPWIPQLGITIHLALDGLSLLLVVLTQSLGLVAVAAGGDEIAERRGLFHFNLLWVLAGITGVFLALDLFLFYFFWEMMLIPAYFLFLWGGQRRLHAGFRFILFTQAGGLLMLLALVGLYFAHGQATGSYTFDYPELLRSADGSPVAFWLMLGFFVGFAVKLPVFPLHSWLPDAYTESATTATIVLSGLMAKTAGYGLLRFLVPLFPTAALAFAPMAMGLAVLGILYGAVLAFGQTNLKRLVACSSISHMGFVLLGVFAWNEMALQGVVMQMLAHGVSVAALFALIAALERRTGTREMARLGGLWAAAPRLGGMTLFFALALLGLPGLGNFVGEFLVLLGTFQVYPMAASLAAIGIVVATVYALWLIQRAFHGPIREGRRVPDLAATEMVVVGALAAAVLWLGLLPQPVMNTAGQALANLQASASNVVWSEPNVGALHQASPPSEEGDSQ